MKKASSRFLAPVIALMMVLAMTVSGAFALDNWDTTTVGLKVATDVSEIGATTGRTLNLTIQGLDKLGNVDIFGVAGGSTIIASVTTLLGNAVSGGATPAAAAAGTLAAVTGYVTLNNGVGFANITYPGSVSGTDTVTVKLYERRKDEGGNTETRLIATTTKDIKVEASAASASILNFEKFAKANGDTSGRSTTAATQVLAPANVAADAGFAMTAARATVNVAGGVFTIKAYKVSSDGTYTLDTSAAGTVTVTLTGAGLAEAVGGNASSTSTVYTATGSMQNGLASVVMPTGWTKAGVYKMVAKMGSITSQPDKVSDAANTVDYFSLVPSTTPASVSLSCDRKVVSNTKVGELPISGTNDGFSYDPTFTASLIDAFGNKIAKSGNTGATVVKVTDANAKISDFNITIAANANAGTTKVDGSGFTAGLASLTASVPLNSSITASSAYALKIVSASNQLVVGVAAGSTTATAKAVTATAVSVGQSFKFFVNGIGVDNVRQDGYAPTNTTELKTLLATDSIKVTCLATKASSTVGVTVGGTSTTINALFNTPISVAQASGTGFLIQDVNESYADFVVKAGNSTFKVAKGSPNKAYVKDGAGNMVTNIVPLVNAAGQFVVKIDGAHVSMKDAYGNTANSGTLTITSTKGTTAGTITPGTGGTVVTLTYPATTTGTDTLSFHFTAPGVSSVNDGSGVKVTFPTVSTLAKFDTYPAEETQTMSVNGALPLTIFPRTDKGATVSQASGYFVDYDTAGLTLQTAAGAAFVTGSNVGAGTGRIAFRVLANTIPGTYEVTIKNIDGTITKTVKYTVVKYTVPLALGASATEIALGASKDIEITGGTSPFTAVSADSSIVTASVSGSTLTVTGVKKGGPVNVTVTDAANKTAVVAVTVGKAAPVTVGGTKTGKDTVNANPDAAYKVLLNTTPEAGDTPAQQWIIIGGTNGVSGTVWYFAYNGTKFVTDLDSTEAAYVGTLTSPFTVSPSVSLGALGYTSAGGGDLYAAYAYSTEATGTFQKLLADGKVIMKNITDLVITKK